MGARTGNASLRTRWLSRRALSLHLLLAVVAPGCAAAGWWQATRALAGNTLSWAYSVEWPAFAVVAIVTWWNLIHEDPEAYRARRRRAPAAGGLDAQRVSPAPLAAGGHPPEVDPVTARLSTALAGLVAFEVLLGIMTLLSVPFSRPGGSLPAKGEAVYLAHAVFGIVVAAAALVLVVRVRRQGRTARVVAWMGLAALALGGAGGLLTEGTEVIRFLGVALMFVAAVLAIFSYMAPAQLRPSRTAAAAGAPAVDTGTPWA